MTQTGARPTAARHDPWAALAALCLGFFVILVDATIVGVALPAIIDDLGTGVSDAVWVSSAYLVAFASALLTGGRLGDRFGHRRIYLAGLAVFTLASLGCGLAGSLGWLVAARVVQGLGAAMISPQTMAIITRIFPEERRGRAMAWWGATAGAATLAGPVLGGLLVDLAGWQWIFFVNLPVGLVGLLLAARLVPRLETRVHRFDWPGTALGATGVLLLVLGLQEGHQHDWSTITGEITVWRTIGAGLVVLAAFVWWQHRARGEPLVPLGLFGDRNFSVANVAVFLMALAYAATTIAFMIFAQLAAGLGPTASGLLMAPTAAMSILLARRVGRLTDRTHPRRLIGVGFVATAGSLAWLAATMTRGGATWELVPALVLLGVGSACVWEPTAATATRHLGSSVAGAGAGVFNSTRQLGAALGAATIALVMDVRLAAHGLPPTITAGGGGELPGAARDALAEAMGQSMLLPAAVALLGLPAVLLFERPRHSAPR